MTQGAEAAEPVARLVRSLGRRDTLALAFGAMIGWGWVVLAGSWITGAGVVGAAIAFVLGGGAVAVIGATYAELASALPFAGGEHVYADRALGARAAFVCTWAIVGGYVSVCAFEAVALPTVLAEFVPGLDAMPLWEIVGWTVTVPWVAVGAGAALLVVWLNVRGIRPAAAFQSAVVLGILAAGGLLALGAVLGGDAGNATPAFAGGVAGVTGVLVMVPFLFVGFDVIPQAAEEVDLPPGDIGRLVVLAVVLATAFYLVVLLAVAVLLGPDARTAAPLVSAEAAGAAFGPVGRALLLGAGLAGIVTSWNGFLVGGSRAVFALARAGQLPAILARVHPRHGTPHAAIVLVGGLAVFAPLFGRPALVWLVNAGGLGITVAYGFVAASFLVLRRREPELPRPFRVLRGGAVGAAALALAVALALLYMPGSPAALAWPAEWALVALWALLGLGLHRRSGAGKQDTSSGRMR